MNMNLKTKARIKRLVEWCFHRGIVTLDVYRMDGTREDWLVHRDI